MESISIAKKILQDSTGSYKNAMESIRIRETRQKCFRILQDPTRSYKILRDTRQKCYGTHINGKQEPTRSCLQDPTRSYKILRDTRQECFGIHINSKQDPTRFYGILDKNAMESISIANEDPTRSCKILQDPKRSCKILQDTRQKWYGIHINSKQDPTGSYKILQDPTRFYGIRDKNVWNPYQ